MVGGGGGGGADLLDEVGGGLDVDIRTLLGLVLVDEVRGVGADGLRWEGEEGGRGEGRGKETEYRAGEGRGGTGGGEGEGRRGEGKGAEGRGEEEGRGKESEEGRAGRLVCSLHLCVSC